MASNIEIALLNLSQNHSKLNPVLADILMDMARAIEQLQKEIEQIKSGME
jgi:hypothetical protein